MVSIRLSARGWQTRTVPVPGSIGPEGFRVGYYGPGDGKAVTVSAEALDGVDCVLGIGSAGVPALAAGATSAPTPLFVRPQPDNGCAVDAGTGGVDAGETDAGGTDADESDTGVDADDADDDAGNDATADAGDDAAPRPAWTADDDAGTELIRSPRPAQRGRGFAGARGTPHPAALACPAVFVESVSR